MADFYKFFYCFREYLHDIFIEKQDDFFAGKTLAFWRLIVIIISGATALVA
jgi:hypothetical protein